jgi:hypothetical protein
MNNQHRSSFKKILQEFPALGHARVDPNKSYRRDRKIDALKRCESDTTHWQRAQINVVIVDLEHMMNTLKIEIEAEQVRFGVNDPKRFDYPTSATALIKRRDNAMRSIDMLRRELAGLERVVEQTGEFVIA